MLEKNDYESVGGIQLAAGKTNMKLLGYGRQNPDHTCWIRVFLYD